MGKAKIRKKNGTYPTPEQIAAQAEIDRRINTKVWYPQASELALPYVPEHAREGVRLASFVHKIAVKAGNCWWTAQTFAHLADTPRVRYVEGLWTRGPENDFCDPDDDGAPHAWNLVDGYRVCLTWEFYKWRIPEDDRWFYEPLNDYSAEEVRDALGSEAGADYYDTLVMSEQSFWNNGGEDKLPEHLRWDKVPRVQDYGHPGGNWGTNRAAIEAWIRSPEHKRLELAENKISEQRNQIVQCIVFRSAAERLMRRYTQRDLVSEGLIDVASQSRRVNDPEVLHRSL